MHIGNAKRCPIKSFRLSAWSFGAADRCDACTAAISSMMEHLQHSPTISHPYSTLSAGGLQPRYRVPSEIVSLAAECLLDNRSCG